MPQKIIAASAPGEGRAPPRAGSRPSMPQIGAIFSGAKPARCARSASKFSVKAVDVLAVVEPFLDDHVHDRVQQRHVGAGAELQHLGGVATQAHAARVHHDQLAAALGELLEIGRGDRVVLDRVGADDDGDIGVLDLVEGRGDRTRADVLHQRRHRGGMAEPGAVIDVVVAEALADQLLEEIGLLVGAFGRAEAGDRLPAVSLCQRGEAAGGDVERLVPACLAEMRQRVGRIDVQPLGRRILAADQRPGQPVRVVDIVEAEAALDAKPALVRRAVDALDLFHPAVLDLQADLAADAAERADRFHLGVEIAAVAASRRHRARLPASARRSGRPARIRRRRHRSMRPSDRPCRRRDRHHGRGRPCRSRH